MGSECLLNERPVLTSQFGALNGSFVSGSGHYGGSRDKRQLTAFLP